MKPINAVLLSCCSLATLLSIGCVAQTTRKFEPLKGGFGYVTEARGGFDDRSLSVTFCYRDTNGNTAVVWPSLSTINGENPVISGDTAFFVGGKAEAFSDGRERLTKRLLAFKGPAGPPIDLTDQVLEKAYRGTGLGLENYMRGSFVSLNQTNQEITIDFVSIKPAAENPHVMHTFDSSVTISWREIESIMKEVQRDGVLRKEESTGSEYMQKELSPGT